MEPNNNQPNFETKPLNDQSVQPAGPVSQPPSTPTVIVSPGAIYGPSPAPVETVVPTPEPGLASSGVDSVEPWSPEPAPAPAVASPSGYAGTVLPNQLPVPESVPLAPAFGTFVAGDMSAPAGQMVTPEVAAGAMTPPSASPVQGRKLLKKAIITGAVAIVLALGGVGYYFGYYTNTSVVYGQSLSNSGKAYDKLVTYFDAQSKIEGKGYVGDGTYKIVSGTTTTDGKLAFRSDGTNSDATVDVGLGVTRVNVELRTIKQTANVNPDVYLKASNLKALDAIIGTGTALDKLEGKWIAVDHTLIDNLQQRATQTGGSMTAPTRDQVVDELHAFGKVNQQYVFSTNKDKAVTTVVKTYGIETVEGHKAVHYKVAFVKANVKKYITAQRDALKSSKLGDWIKKNDYQKSVDSSYTELTKSADTIKLSDTIDVWSDINTRVIYKVRVSDNMNLATGYVDLGLDYKNSNSYPFFINTQSKDGKIVSSGSLIANLDVKANSLTLKAAFKNTGYTSSSIDGTFTFKPSNKSAKIDVPTGAQPLSQVLDSLGLGGLLSSAESSFSTETPGANPADTKRKSDLRSLQTYTEAFFAENSYYPSLAEINSVTWVKTNMPSVPTTAFRDPEGSASLLVSTPVAHNYSYQPRAVNGASCDGSASKTCASYTLTATLSDGSVYTRASLD